MKFDSADYVVMMYDVGQKHVNKVYKIGKKYLVPFQRSVLRGKISAADFLKLKQEVLRVLDLRTDFVAFMRMSSERSFFEEHLGVRKIDAEALIL